MFGVDINEDTSLVFSCGGDKVSMPTEETICTCMELVLCD